MATATLDVHARRPDAPPRPDWTRHLLRWSVRILTATVWISATLFGLYILTGYVAEAALGNAATWNELFPRIHSPRSTAANIGIGTHFALGAVLLLLGPIQLIRSVRERWPRVHRWIGWLYAGSAIVTGLGGLTFILLRGTIGGPPMSIAFGTYGALVVLSAVQAVRLARARQLERHRRWAIRLFALAIGSWLYRMEYGFWFMTMGKGAGHTSSFDGWFDLIMNWWFFVPNLLLAEALIRARRQAAPPWLRASTAGVMVLATLFLALGTFFFTAMAWGPMILWRLGLG